MMQTRRVSVRAAALAGALLFPAVLAAQVPLPRPRPAISVSGGAQMFDRTDTSAGSLMAAFRGEIAMGIAVLELAASASDPPPSVADAPAQVVEALVQLPIPVNERMTPYLGVGAGMARLNSYGSTSDDARSVLTAAAGVRVAFRGQLGLVADARIRGLGSSFRNSHTDVTLGLRYQFGRSDYPRFRGGR